MTVKKQKRQPLRGSGSSIFYKANSKQSFFGLLEVGGFFEDSFFLCGEAVEAVLVDLFEDTVKLGLQFLFVEELFFPS